MKYANLKSKNVAEEQNMAFKEDLKNDSLIP